MVATYAGQIIMGGCLQIKLAPWKRVALTRVIALGPSLAVAATTTNNMALFNNINEYLNILQSVQLPFAMLPVLHFAAQESLLGRFKSKTVLSAVTTVLALLVMGVNTFQIQQFVAEFPGWALALVSVYAVFYFAVCLRMVWDEVKHLLLCCLACLRIRRQPAEEQFVEQLTMRPLEGTQVLAGQM